MAKKYFPALKLRGESYEIAEAREPGERRIIPGKIDIDYKCFKKTKAEKELLKAVKAQAKLHEMKKNSYIHN